MSNTFVCSPDWGDCSPENDEDLYAEDWSPRDCWRSHGPAQLPWWRRNHNDAEGTDADLCASSGLVHENKVDCPHS
jgi:hypothetical protein